jgi:hypothetical protein
MIPPKGWCESREPFVQQKYVAVSIITVLNKEAIGKTRRNLEVALPVWEATYR